MFFVILLLFVAACDGSATKADGDIGDDGYYESGDNGGYNDNYDTGDSNAPYPEDSTDTGSSYEPGADPAEPGYEDWESSDSDVRRRYAD